VNNVHDVLQADLADLKRPGVLTVRPGYRLDKNNWPTKEQVAVVTVDPAAFVAATAGLPAQLSGLPIDIRPANQMQRIDLEQPALFALIRATIRPEAKPPDFTNEVWLGPRPAVSGADLVTSAARQIDNLGYTPATNAAGATVPLDPQEGNFTLICCASPDDGWNQLQAFFEGTTDALKVAMYDFTSAHILKAANSALAKRTLDLCLDHPPGNPTSDQTDEDSVASLAKNIESFDQAWALERSDPFAGAWIFPNAYHIKVAVRDSTSFWLSSGNWNNSNQPEFDPNNPDQSVAKKSDRDWHVIVLENGLAKTFESYIMNDLSVAKLHQSDGFTAPLQTAIAELALVEPTLTARNFKRFFEAAKFENELMMITPLLTPDPGIYAARIKALIKAAENSFWMQTQYIHPSGKDGDQEFDALIEALAEAQTRLGANNVRVIMSQWETSAYLEQVQAAGIDLKSVRIQQGVHNKGMIVDGKTVVVSSQNWSADGVLRNRDAGLIIKNEKVAAYFSEIFTHDWDNLARQQAVK
jgi:PLD-like domain